MAHTIMIQQPQQSALQEILKFISDSWGQIITIVGLWTAIREISKIYQNKTKQHQVELIQSTIKPDIDKLQESVDRLETTIDKLTGVINQIQYGEHK